ncbi:hypothetical protein HMF8227_02323 [Saliniradius amylolyticus]|uniref:Bro-N domain-containing protein n=1 Tax=Saliniradius amylolyticus TaxID=2183582 RepID=A0A2S2E546_9ALTE|nr:BRO family protein [Saliniradius amylolyticus]AWL12775.1 hypothetical protein HMF8227_02323 [Saliniradius amylolyticus]
MLKANNVVNKEFNGQSVTLIPHQGDLWMTMEMIGQALEYADPRKAVHKLYERNKEELNEYSTVVRLTTVEGDIDKRRNVRVFNEEGVMVLSMLSGQPKAAAFRRWAVQVLKAYRHQQLTLSNSVPVEHDKFLEKMVIEAGKRNPYARTILQERYGLQPSLLATVECPECFATVPVKPAP